MSMEDVIVKQCILLKKDVQSKEDALHMLADCLNEEAYITDPSEFLKDIHKREEEFCTYVGHETAIPHAISNCVSKAGIAFLRSDKAFQYGSSDETVKLLFMLAIPKDSNEQHLRMLSSLATKLMHKEFREQLLNAESISDVYEILMLH